MQQHSTPEQVLRFLYHELDRAESLDLTRRIRRDNGLREAYEQLAQAKRLLPNVRFQPSRRLRDRILAYSRHAEIGREV